MSKSDRAWRSPLHHAALEDDVAEVRRLVVAGAEVDARDSLGFAPLHLAAQEFSVRAARELLGSGASVDAQNRFGNTPLFVAVFTRAVVAS